MHIGFQNQEQSDIGPKKGNARGNLSIAPAYKM